MTETLGNPVEVKDSDNPEPQEFTITKDDVDEEDKDMEIDEDILKEDEEMKSVHSAIEHKDSSNMQVSPEPKHIPEELDEEEKEPDSPKIKVVPIIEQEKHVEKVKEPTPQPEIKSVQPAKPSTIADNFTPIKSLNTMNPDWIIRARVTKKGAVRFFNR